VANDGTRWHPVGRCGSVRGVSEGRLSQVLGAWGGVELAEPMAGGNRSVVVSATLSGARVVVRRSRRSEAGLEWELKLMEHLRAVGLATPEVVAAADGRLQVDGVSVIAFVEGRQPDTADDWARVAEYLSRLHELGRGTAQRPGFRSARELLMEEQGGDVDLQAMPVDAVRLCRAAWAPLSSLPVTVIHGDPGASNIVITQTDVVLLDWDEARVDCPWFDLAALPDEVSPLHGEDRQLAARAADAWEAAVGWVLEPAYARRRLQQLN
jgi:Ser/Thr protein kinase RdoA (MazF antagonist)